MWNFKYGRTKLSFAELAWTTHCLVIVLLGLDKRNGIEEYAWATSRFPDCIYVSPLSPDRCRMYRMSPDLSFA
ncbi:hypothetical protein GWI33_013425 [Rhynchophorus ferrugineus]|uniref:Uncharacterized protein n=1 Tax=Rhynchophorus ferrugineus TaxID=354439 RepID=A0A834I6I5_RHYFE|nr:hypothetical protein GWI33_013425 [Rhynchophorus ferrugineus]